MENDLTIISRVIHKDLRRLEKSHQVISDWVECLIKTYKLECQYTDDYLLTTFRQGRASVGGLKKIEKPPLKAAISYLFSCSIR